MILEDDVILRDDFKDGVLICKESNFDFVRLFALFEEEQKGCLRICMSKKRLGGTQGYYLTPRAARILIRYSKRWISPVDDFLDRYFIHKLPNALFQPFLLEENKILESNIGVRDKPRGIFKLTRELIRLIWVSKKFLYDLKRQWIDFCR